MQKIYICEDDITQLQELKEYITNFTLLQGYDMAVDLATTNPDELIEHINKNKVLGGIYFLDINLHHQLTGFSLGNKIKQIDEASKIIIVTGYEEFSNLTFKYKVEAMDYILKSNPVNMKKRISECLNTIVERAVENPNISRNVFKFKDGDIIRFINYKDIMFFETSTTPHKIKIHLDNGIIEFYGKIKEIANEELGLIKCHESIVVNKYNISEINRKTRTITMKNGEETICSTRLIKNLLE
ncbi:MAG: LytTR family DNA-binding domain-containing protein [Miniphocaeibacter sp.]|uniref:LytR/AlgR family response regulator transcription factor n=1 Tax=Miniphocaeibacter sp. TaxID=3100973 RepID=UPI0017F8A424|nr:response regulator transcription factor [Gallicola sp.]